MILLTRYLQSVQKISVQVPRCPLESTLWFTELVQFSVSFVFDRADGKLYWCTNPANGHVDLRDLRRLVTLVETILGCICANHEKIKLCQDAFVVIAHVTEDAKRSQEVTKDDQLTELTLLKHREKQILHLEQKVVGQDVHISQLWINILLTVSG